MEDCEYFEIEYNIRFDGGEERSFLVRLEAEKLRFVPAGQQRLDEWAELSFHKCPNCTLDPAANRYCPVAVNLEEMVYFTKDLVSHEEVEVVVRSRERTYAKRAPMQTVASSLMGIVMVTSGCPVLDKMRPMVETHLPFASWEETAYRFVTMYLFAQYFMHKKGKKADWDLVGLMKLFDDIEEVNFSFCDRLDHVRTKDASVNAVSILSSMSQLTKMSIAEHAFEHWERLFMAYFDRD